MSEISFHGLTSKLTQTILTKNQIDTTMLLYPEARGFVGNLPKELIVRIPPQNRKDIILNIQKEFSKVVEQCRKGFTTRKATKTLKKILIENKIIFPKTKLKIKYAGSGDFAEVYKLLIGSNKYAIKIFKNTKFNPIERFGNMVEQNNALYLNAKNGSDWVKFYFGNLIDKYMVNKYISWADKPPSQKTNLSKKGIEYIDYNITNFINGVNVDYGGIKVLPDFPINDKIAIKTINKLSRLSSEKQLEEIKKIEDNKKNLIDYKHKKIGINYFLKTKQKMTDIPKNVGFFEELLYYFTKYV